MPICPNCSSHQPDGAAFCDECGSALSGPAPLPGMQGPSAGAPTVVASGCPVCGAQVAPGEAFCNSCGAALGGAAPAPGPYQDPYQQAPAFPQPSSGATCPNCGAQLEPDSTFCDMCGSPVTPGGGGGFDQMSPFDYAPPPAGGAPQDKTMLAPQPGGGAGLDYGMPPQVAPPPVDYGAPQAAAPYPPVDYGHPPAQPPVGVAPPPPTTARFVVQGTSATLPFPPGKAEIVIGREDPVSGIFPDVDLTNHGGDEGGVSRQHARIVIQGNKCYIEDLNSTNYTFVNQQKLLPRQPQLLEDGAEVRFGRVKLVFYS
ncbi:MAG: zinc ribbon domain-containing protein [Anaerolineae bacterium]|nr:zinc ribbon domain-containing protein [Anaerolineae bacterium]